MQTGAARGSVGPVKSSAVLAVVASLALSACAPITSRLSDAKALEGTPYHFAQLSRKQGRAVERLSPEPAITSRYAAEGERPIYVISDPGVASIPRFGFAPLSRARVDVRLERVSDVGGGGIDNGVVRRDASFSREYEDEEIASAITLLQGLSTDPIAVIQRDAPEEWKTVGSNVQIEAKEAGFAIRIAAELRTGNPFDASTQLVLYRLETRSAYQRASDASAEPQ